MKQIKPEFARPFEIAKLPNSGAHERVSADARECKALAKRMDLPAIDALAASLHIRPWRGGGVKVDGTLTADITQESVISLEAFRSTVSFPVERCFLPGGGAEDGADDRVDALHGGVIDLGELVAETLALELDPYPRKPGEVFPSGEEPAAQVPQSPLAELAKGLKMPPGK